MKATWSACLLILAISGYLMYGLAFSSVISAMVLWATGNLPWGDWTSVGIQATVGSAIGHGAVPTLIAIPVWLALCLVPMLRWLRAWWVALLLGNALSVAAAVAAYLRQAT